MLPRGGKRARGEARVGPTRGELFEWTCPEDQCDGAQALCRNRRTGRAHTARATHGPDLLTVFGGAVHTHDPELASVRLPGFS